MTKVQFLKKNHDSKGKPSHSTKDKHQIEKMFRKLDIDDLVQIH